MIDAALRICTQCLAPKPGESALVITNPHPEVEPAARAFQEALTRLGVEVTLLIQAVRDSATPMDEAVTEALYRRPAILVSLTYSKLGSDPRARGQTLAVNGRVQTHIVQYLIFGERVSRGFWSPNVRLSDIELAARLDWDLLRQEALQVRQTLERSVEIHVRTPAGTDLRFSTVGRTAFVDDGDFRRPGQGGNLPPGEVFLSPGNRTAKGRLVVDGSQVFRDGSELLDEPLVLEFDGGLFHSASGPVAARLLDDIERSLPPDATPTERENCRHLGEFGIGLLPCPGLTGRVLIDEKARGTCHLAIGANYDGDAPAPIHYDGVLLRPTVDARDRDGRWVRLLEDGTPCW